MSKRKLLLIASLFTLCLRLFAKGESYVFDFWDEYEKSPDAYCVSSVLYADDLDLEGGLKNPSSLFCIDNLVYVVDTENNRIIELEYTDKKTVELIRVIDSFNCDDSSINTNFSGPMDIFISQEGEFFIADTNNGRVLKLDKDLNYLLEFNEPDDPTYEKGKTFFPQKIVVDTKGRLYVLAKNVNKGFIKYEYDGTFTGFYGANTVSYNALDLLWKKLSTRAQREQMISFVPTEYSNAFMDSEGFIFAVTKTFEEWDLLSGQSKPIVRLNALGKDILVKNGLAIPVGELQWGNAAGIKGPAHFNDVTVLDNEVYVVIDETRGRIFGYDNQGELLYIFGNKGNVDGYFRSPVAIEHIGKDLFVLDSMNASITIFTPTRYGDLIYKATEEYATGDYIGSANTWNDVLKINGNNQLAYIGLGKSYLRQERYKDAMDLFKLKHARKNYSKAFMYYRKEWIEANIGKCLIVLLVLILIPFIIKRVRAFIRELKSL